jgi:predicted secreted protein
MAVKRYALILLLLAVGIPSANAACTQKTCVDVFTDKNQLVITAQKGAVKPSAKAVPKAIATPKPVVKAPIVKPPTPKPPTPKPPAPKPVVKKPVVKPVIKPVVKKPATASLSDKLIKLLPAGDINFQPGTQSVVGIPTYFWTKTPQRFQAVIPILDVIVYVNLYATFNWSFGDGEGKFTVLKGGPFPNPAITHTYASKGYKDVELKVIWQGTWSVNGVTLPIAGDLITQSINKQLTVASAPTLFN